MAPLRVLHIVGKMDRGGIETWLMHMLRRLDRSEVAFDFLVETSQPAAYDEEVRNLGARIIHCQRTRQLVSYWLRLSDTLRQSGPFDVVHSHAHFFNGLTLAVAAQLGVQVRVAHSHTDMRIVGPPGFVRRWYYMALRQSVRRHMTHGIAVSDGAAQELFGAGYVADRRVRVIPCGIDYAPFLSNPDRQGARLELNIAQNARVLGHVGRLHPSKNHQFLLEAFARAAQTDARLHLLLVGDGEPRPALEKRVEELGLRGKVTFAGVRSDVPRMLAAMDVFAFPSVFEGLGLALIEAQAAGLPIVVSDCIPSDALILTHWVRRLSLADSGAWSSALLEAAGLPSEKRTPSFSPKFDIRDHLQELLSVYRSGSALLSAEDNRPVRQVAALEQRRQVHPRH